MTTACAIYGYEFTREFAHRGMRFLPRYTRVTEAHDKARDLGRYHLTGVVILDKHDDHQIFCLEAVLSFIEHLDVLISDPISVTDSDVFAPFSPVARTAKRHNGGGAVLHQDAFFHEMRSSFIGLAMNKLADDQFCEGMAGEPSSSRQPFHLVSAHRTSTFPTFSSSLGLKPTFAAPWAT